MRNLYLTIALSFATAAAGAPPRQVEISYEIARNGSVLAEVNQRLEHDGRSYRLAESWKGKGLLSLRGEAHRSSQGAVVDDGLRPLKFEDKRSGRETLHAEFDPAAKAPTLQQQDQLSFMWTLAFAPPRDMVTASVADGKHVTTYTYKVAGRERVKTPAGEFDALKLVKRRDKPSDKATEIWLAADRQYLPVRVLVIDKDGASIDQVAVKISVK
jgi:uncharacterized protein DUF3108